MTVYTLSKKPAQTKPEFLGVQAGVRRSEECLFERSEFTPQWDWTPACTPRNGALQRAWALDKADRAAKQMALSRRIRIN